MICFIIALPKEAEKLLNMTENLENINLADKLCYKGVLCGKDVIIAISGIGKVSAALTTQLLIDKFSPKFIFNFGTCGGTNNSVSVTNYYLIDKCCQYDFDLSKLDNVPIGYIQDYDTVFFPTTTHGLEDFERVALASADKFTCEKSDVDVINRMGCAVCDMEGGAIAQVCTSNNVPLYMIKGISDVHGSGTQSEQFYKNLQAVGDGFPAVIIKALKRIIEFNNI